MYYVVRKSGLYISLLYNN